jgi:hypothetical protein
VNETHSITRAPASDGRSRNLLLGTMGWVWVGAPFCYGIVQLMIKIPALVTG